VREAAFIVLATRMRAPQENAMRRFGNSAILAFAALLASCAIGRSAWVKVDGENADVEFDWRECRQLAADEMWRMSWDTMWPPRFYDPTFMPPFYLNRRPFWYDFPTSIELEQALVDFCMHSKGYRLERLPQTP
jgi:hypothetical protein